MRFLRRQFPGRLDRPLAHRLPGGQQLAPGALGEEHHADVGEQLVRRAELLARVDAAVLAAQHNWWDWYAAYLAARQDGDTPEQADKAADAYMEEAYGVVVSR